MFKLCRRCSLLIVISTLSACTVVQNMPLEDLVDLRRQAAQSYQQGDYQRAALYFEELTAQVPREAELWFLLGNSRARLGSLDEAIEAYKEAVVRDPQLAKAWYNMGLLTLREGAQLLLEAHKNLPDSPEMQSASLALSEGVIELVELQNRKLVDQQSRQKHVVNPDEVEIIYLDKTALGSEDTPGRQTVPAETPDDKKGESE